MTTIEVCDLHSGLKAIAADNLTHGSCGSRFMIDRVCCVTYQIAFLSLHTFSLPRTSQCTCSLVPRTPRVPSNYARHVKNPTIAKDSWATFDGPLPLGHCDRNTRSRWSVAKLGSEDEGACQMLVLQKSPGAWVWGCEAVRRRCGDGVAGADTYLAV